MASQNTVFKASDAEICTPVTKLITNDRMTFAKKALDGVEVRWTSNPVERAMGEVAKRCKRDWMQWSQVGLDAVLQLRLVKYQDPDLYSKFLDEILCRSTHEQINCTVSVDALGGEV